MDATQQHCENAGESCFHRKRLEGPELEGPEHFEKKYQNVPGAAGPAAGAAAASIYSKITKKIPPAARSAAVCIFFVIFE